MEAIIQSIRRLVTSMARENNFEWFFDLHQPEVLACAEELLEHYPEADKNVVRLACWLHDIVHYTAKNEKEILLVKDKHHIVGADMANRLLKEYGVKEGVAAKVAKCIERHRNLPDYEPQALEEKILACADARSHFKSVFYLSYFKIHPEHSIEVMIEKQKEKIWRDSRDIQLLPKGCKFYTERCSSLLHMLCA